MQAPCLSVIMPVYNEGATIGAALDAVLKQPQVAELIIVNDASTDETGELLEKIKDTDPRIQLFHHFKNQGKGAALRTGIVHSRADIVIIQDADLEYDPSEYGLLLRPILTGKADAIFGPMIHRLSGTSSALFLAFCGQSISHNPLQYFYQY